MFFCMTLLVKDFDQVNLNWRQQLRGGQKIFKNNKTPPPPPSRLFGIREYILGRINNRDFPKIMLGKINYQFLVIPKLPCFCIVCYNVSLFSCLF